MVLLNRFAQSETDPEPADFAAAEPSNFVSVGVADGIVDLPSAEGEIAVRACTDHLCAPAVLRAGRQAAATPAYYR